MAITVLNKPVGGPAAMRPRSFRLSPNIIPGLIRGLDGVSFAAAGTLAFAFPYMSAPPLDQPHIGSLVTIVFLYYAMATTARLFDVEAAMRPISRADDLVVASVTALFLFLAFAFSMQVSNKVSEWWLLQFVVSACAIVLVSRALVGLGLRSLARRGVVGRNLVLLGSGEQAQRFLSKHERTYPYFTRLAGVYSLYADGDDNRVERTVLRGDLDDLLADVRRGDIDDIVLALPWNSDRQLVQAIERLKELPVNVYLSSDLVGFELAFRPVLGEFGETPVFEVVTRPISGWSSALKVLEDYVIAGLLVLLLSPLLLIIAIFIKIDSPGPVFFKQPRLGFNNQIFEIYKFRSMYHQSKPETVVRQATRHDPRVTRVGRIIRMTSLDELPQLFNVLRGDMSVVGPRPHALSHNEEFGRAIRGYFARHRVKPGITGWAQVNGWRGETETLDKMEKRIEYDIYYADNWSIMFDIKILIMTVLVVPFQKSAY